MYCTWNTSQGTDIHINDKFSEAMRRQDRRMAKECIGGCPSSLLRWLNGPNIFYKRKMGVCFGGGSKVVWLLKFAIKIK